MDILALNIESFAKQYATFTLIDTRATTTYNVAHLKDSINLATKDSISIFIQENFNLQDSNTTNNFNLSSPPPPLVSRFYFSAFQPRRQRNLQSFL
ncbi:MAG: hypothetical protein SPJ83_05935 [Helicobacter sp.]|uniref:hypothetical protein n=1 Tax=Helicobacter sp. TaxID=218 RepID=UPI002A90DFC4|nr:hypothetical protein [Helicobacter sp.]MDY5822323.1 hypothetical protein [Helicobacter sp.]